MTTLAEAMLEAPLPPAMDRERCMSDRMVRTLLRPPSDLVRMTAERFVFDHDPPMVVAGLVRSGAIEGDVVMECSRQVADPMWMEWPNEWKVGGVRDDFVKRIGAMIVGGEMTGRRTVVIMVMESTKGMIGAFLTMSLNGFPARDGEEVRLHWGIDLHTCMDYCNMYLLDVTSCLFMLCTPRVCEEVRVGPSRQQRRYLERNKLPPFVEYRRVSMRVGVAPPRYSQQASHETREGMARKLHKVIGHFRTYREGREVPKVSFVPEHWRGDPELGMIIHRRDIKT